MTTTLTARWRVVTPLFCGGADPITQAELRLPSLKGVLRFWWRALARPGRILAETRREEDMLFGSAAGGQSRVLLSLREAADPPLLSAGQVLQSGGTVVGEGVRYLGYGLMEAFASRKRGTQAGQLTRACLRESFEFTLALRCRRLAREQIESLVEALKCLGLVGGLGARSRRGFGSLVLLQLDQDGERLWEAPADLSSLSSELSRLLRCENELPEHTAFSGLSRIVLVPGRLDEPPLALLERLGRQMMLYRSWGHGGRVLGCDSEKNFRQDHDLMKLPVAARPAHPRRIAFGLPHNYGRPADQQVGPAWPGLDRRASPLFLHIHQAKTSVAVVSLLPARFLPRGQSDISVGGKAVPQALEEELYRPLHEFLDRLKKQPGALEVTA